MEVTYQWYVVDCPKSKREKLDERWEKLIDILVSSNCESIGRKISGLCVKVSEGFDRLAILMDKVTKEQRAERFNELSGFLGLSQDENFTMKTFANFMKIHGWELTEIISKDSQKISQPKKEPKQWQILTQKGQKWEKKHKSYKNGDIKEYVISTDLCLGFLITIGDLDPNSSSWFTKIVILETENDPEKIHLILKIFIDKISQNDFHSIQAIRVQTFDYSKTFIGLYFTKQIIDSEVEESLERILRPFKRILSPIIFAENFPKPRSIPKMAELPSSLNSSPKMPEKYKKLHSALSEASLSKNGPNSKSTKIQDQLQRIRDRSATPPISRNSGPTQIENTGNDFFNCKNSN